MKLLTAKDIIAVAKSRGFNLRVDSCPPPMPILIVPSNVNRNHATAVLMDALRAWRLEIIDELLKESK